MTFVAGLGFGVLLGKKNEPQANTSIPPHLLAYHQALSERMEMTTEQSGDLLTVLQCYDRERNQITSKLLSESSEWGENLDSRYENLIKEHILTTSQRQKFKFAEWGRIAPFPDGGGGR